MQETFLGAPALAGEYEILRCCDSLANALGARIGSGQTFGMASLDREALECVRLAGVFGGGRRWVS
jgi:hypothetical protein